MYSIEIDYSFGDSFTSGREKRKLPLTWKDQRLAREALQAIKSHAIAVKQCNECPYDQRKHFIKRLKSKPWFKFLDIKDYGPDIYEMWEFGVAVKLDNGDWNTLHTFWTGYFETLHGAKIVSDCDLDSFEMDT